MADPTPAERQRAKHALAKRVRAWIAGGRKGQKPTAGNPEGLMKIVKNAKGRRLPRVKKGNLHLRSGSGRKGGKRGTYTAPLKPDDLA